MTHLHQLRIRRICLMAARKQALLSMQMQKEAAIRAELQDVTTEILAWEADGGKN